MDSVGSTLNPPLSGIIEEKVSECQRTPELLKALQALLQEEEPRLSTEEVGPAQWSPDLNAVFMLPLQRLVTG